MADSPFGNWNAADFWRPWLQLAPTSLVQPISFSINSNNSTAPQTEVAVVARHSYGRQIGRMSDALRALILEGRSEPLKSKPMQQFIDMWKEIDKVKNDSAKARVEQIASDLFQLKASLSDKEYEQLRDDLLRALQLTE